MTDYGRRLSSTPGRGYFWARLSSDGRVHRLASIKIYSIYREVKVTLGIPLALNKVPRGIIFQSSTRVFSYLHNHHDKNLNCCVNAYASQRPDARGYLTPYPKVENPAFSFTITQ